MSLENLHIEFLTSTMNGVWPKLCDQAVAMNCDVLIINQHRDEQDRLEPKEGIRVYNYRERGVARSRNRALSHARGDVCVFCDNDVTLVPDIVNVLQKACRAMPESDILTFRIRTPEGRLYRNYRTSSFSHNLLSIASVREMEIVFRLAPIKRIGLRFDERFGLGSAFPTGEGNIFLADALKKNLRIAFVPEELIIHPWMSSGKRFENKELMIAKGALFRRMYGPAGAILSRALTLIKYPYYKKHYGLAQALQLIGEGERLYVQSKNRD
ncbi:MAG: glycosyltransferase family 2 protein [Myxococcales bacterium]|nr:MAG: glycosyltransferase family 2 protein [Myxococcales bacterium]